MKSQYSHSISFHNYRIEHQLSPNHLNTKPGVQLERILPIESQISLLIFPWSRLMPGSGIRRPFGNKPRCFWQSKGVSGSSAGADGGDSWPDFGGVSFGKWEIFPPPKSDWRNNQKSLANCKIKPYNLVKPCFFSWGWLCFVPNNAHIARWWYNCWSFGTFAFCQRLRLAVVLKKWGQLLQKNCSASQDTCNSVLPGEGCSACVFGQGMIWESAIYVTCIHVSRVSHVRFFISLLDTTLAQKLTGLSSKNTPLLKCPIFDFFIFACKVCVSKNILFSASLGSSDFSLGSQNSWVSYSLAQLMSLL